MAKKKLFGNRKEPCCGTCAHGKLSASGDTVLCVRGGALPLTHHCRRYVYDPLRRTPKRRPLPEAFDASAFSLDDPPTAVATAQEPTTEVTSAAQTATPATSDHSTFDHLFEYLNSHDTPDAETILAILTRSVPPEEVAVQEAEQPAQEADEEPPVQPSALPEEPTPSLDDSTDITGDLERLDMDSLPSFATLPLDSAEIEEALLEAKQPSQDMVFLPQDAAEPEDAPLSADDLIFLPKDTPSDNDSGDPLDGGFTPLTGNE
ncbi:MAG: hypothetical protein E7553_03195 [Ruminococcaceae bacterium]|nr:hypothetical protein [Oscillospiraceae bacterium]